jgi:hypothetical protein
LLPQSAAGRFAEAFLEFWAGLRQRDGERGQTLAFNCGHAG